MRRYDHTTPDSGLGQSVAPIVFGLGTQPRADLVHVLWPDGVLQCELNRRGRREARPAREQPQDRELPGTFHVERRADSSASATSSAAAASAISSRPASTASPIATSRWRSPTTSSGRPTACLRISVTEPMDEIAYIDHLRLEVVDRPSGRHGDPRRAVRARRAAADRRADRLADADRSRPRLRPGRPRPDRRPSRDWDRRTADAIHEAGPLDRLRRGTRHHPRLRRPPRRYLARPTRWCSAWPGGSSTPTRRRTTPPPRRASR